MHHTENMALITLTNYFNEEESVLQTIVENGGEGIYVLTEVLTGGFTLCEKVDSVPEDLTTDEEGRIIVETETERTHYVYFILP